MKLINLKSKSVCPFFQNLLFVFVQTVEKRVKIQAWLYCFACKPRCRHNGNLLNKKTSVVGVAEVWDPPYVCQTDINEWDIVCLHRTCIERRAETKLLILVDCVTVVITNLKSCIQITYFHYHWEAKNL